MLWKRNRVLKVGWPWRLKKKQAYDRLIWKFLRSILMAFGFHQRWINWVISCYSSTSMTFLLNGAPFQTFKPKRGLRQGDPISPYLFILCMEVLSRLINQRVAAGYISGFKLNRHFPALHHLLFADAVLLLGKCSVNEAFFFKDCLDTFCFWFGQTFNPSKSNIFFNKRASSKTVGLITAMMGFEKISPKAGLVQRTFLFFLRNWTPSWLGGRLGPFQEQNGWFS